MPAIPRVEFGSGILGTLLRALGLCGWLIAPVLILALLAVGVGYFRLQHGPVSLSFLTGSIERGINTELTGFDARIDDVLVVLNDTGGLQFRLKNVRLAETDGDLVASAPLAAVELSTSALWGLRLAPSRIELIDPLLYLFYSESSGLALSFSRPAADPDATGREPRLDAPPPPAATPNPEASPEALRRIDLAGLLIEASARARQGQHATSELKQLGLRNARVRLENGGRASEWIVPEVTLDLEHQKKRSIVSGSATVASTRGPWTIDFRTDDSEKTQTIALKISVRNLVPRAVAEAVPQVPWFQTLDTPVAADAAFDLASSGDVQGANVIVNIGRGNVLMPGLPDRTMLLDAGHLELGYDRAQGQAVLSPSTLESSGSRVTLVGTLAADKAGGSGWLFDIKATEGRLAAEEFGTPALPIEHWSAKGRLHPEQSRIEIDHFGLKAGGGEITLSGEIVGGGAETESRVDVSVGPMPVSTLAAMWPRLVAPGARQWVGRRIIGGQVKGGTISYQSASARSQSLLDAGQRAEREERLSVTMEGEALRMIAATGLIPLEAPRALLRVSNGVLEASVPEAQFVLDGQRRVPMKAGRFASTDFMSDWPTGDIAFQIASPLAPVLEVLDRPPLRLLDLPEGALGGIDGKVNGQFRISLPLIADLDPTAIAIEGRAAVTDGRAKQLLGAYSVQGAKIDIDVTGKAVDANGEMLLNGVLAKVNWQRIFDAPADKQPPLRITANLDNSDRVQLGLDVNHIVEGEVPVELTIVRRAPEEPAIHLRADLTNASLTSEALGWQKPAGREAYLQCDVASGKTHKTELQNFKIAGENIAIEGWIGVGADSRVREFYFPDFSLNVVTRLEVQGTLGTDNIWKVRAKGPTYDGRDFFRSLFSVGHLVDAPAKPQKPTAGIDLEADVETVIGFSETNLRGLKLKVSKRKDKLTALEARGTLDGGMPLVTVYQETQGEPRKLLADSTDAGQTFRLVGFYPNVQGGRARLEVNLDAKGAAEKSGTLWVEDFKILGDPVASEVFGSVDSQPRQGGPAQPKRRVVRQVFEFDRMRVPFSVGYGQFVLENAYLRGPLLGATIRGKVDYKSQALGLSGTYIPLQGLNNLFVGVPLLGDILSGPNKEGIFGITFAIQGPMAKPQVVVNPLSLVAPGIFREMFQMGALNPKVQPRAEGITKIPVEKRVRASSTPAGNKASGTPGPEPKAIDGWASETVVPTVKN